MRKAVLMELGILGLGIMIGGLSLLALARTNQTDSEAMETYARTSSVTQHKMTLDGEPLSYKATTGFLPYYNKKGKKRTRIFYTAYTRERIARFGPQKSEFSQGIRCHRPVRYGLCS